MGGGGEDKKSRVLQKVQLEVIPNVKCFKETGYRGIENYMDETMLCAWGEDRDACGGDSGGPLVPFGRRKARGGCLWVSSPLGSGVEDETTLEYIPALLFILIGSGAISYRRDPNFVKIEVGFLID